MVADDGYDEGGDSMDDDIAERIIPMDASTMGDVYPQPSTLIDTHAQSQTPTHSHPPQAPMAGATGKPDTRLYTG
jgi:hypothetical protein